MRVLIADDEPDFREMLAEYLVSHGVEVIEAANGLETLLHITRDRPDAVVLDLRMPRLGGIEALRRIRSFDPALTVVVVTAAIEPELHEQSRTLGARAVFHKPVALPELLRTLQGQSVSRRASDDAVTAHGSPPAPAPSSPSRTSVLVVDDEPEVREALMEFLIRRGYQTRAAADGASAVRALIEAPTDVVLLDIGLPGLSGTDALPTIRAVAPRAIVIMVSGIADETVAKHALAHGAFDYLVKPVDWSYLAQSLETALAMNVLDL